MSPSIDSDESDGYVDADNIHPSDEDESDEVEERPKSPVAPPRTPRRRGENTTMFDSQSIDFLGSVQVTPPCRKRTRLN